MWDCRGTSCARRRAHPLLHPKARARIDAPRAPYLPRLSQGGAVAQYPLMAAPAARMLVPAAPAAFGPAAVPGARPGLGRAASAIPRQLGAPRVRARPRCFQAYSCVAANPRAPSDMHGAGPPGGPGQGRLKARGARWHRIPPRPRPRPLSLQASPPPPRSRLRRSRCAPRRRCSRSQRPPPPATPPPRPAMPQPRPATPQLPPATPTRQLPPWPATRQLPPPRPATRQPPPPRPATPATPSPAPARR